MKNILLFILLMFVAFTLKLNAQSYVVHTDNFDSYTTGTSVATLGYLLWECGATIKADIPANTGVNYASIAGTAAKANYMRKRFAVIAGHDYTFNVYTLAPAGTTHKIGCRSQTGTLVNVISPTNLNNNTWTKQSISFTAVNAENVDAYLYIWGAATLHSDDWEVIDETAKIIAGTENTSKSTVEIFKTGNNEVSINGCEVQNCRLYDLNGKLVQTATTNQFEVNSSLKGVYIAKISDKSGEVYLRKFAL